MKIGTVKELKAQEFRVGLIPSGVAGYVSAGHTCYVEKGAGLGAGFSDEEYAEAGAILTDSAKEVFENSDMIVKVKELDESEYAYLKEGQILYSFLHSAANKEMTEVLMEKGVTGVAFETITDKNGSLPCLKPMSMIAGKLSIQEGAKYLEKGFEGRGILLGGVPGVERGKVVVLGAGTAGENAARVALGMGAEVTLIDNNLDRLAQLTEVFGTSVTTLFSSETNIVNAVKQADLVVGTVLVPGSKTPQILKRDYVKQMKKGSVIVDVAIDQGGTCESSHPTSHDNPIFIEEGVIHYCVPNMPGAVAYTATIALANATFKYGLMMANEGILGAVNKDPGLKNGLNTYNHSCVNSAVADSLGLTYTEI